MLLAHKQLLIDVCICFANAPDLHFLQGLEEK